MNDVAARSFLDRMAAGSRERTRAARLRVPDAEMLRRARSARPAARLALDPGGFDLLAEIKPESPSAGRLLGSTGDALARARAYVAAGAAAVSVLTEPEAFGGSLELLAEVAGSIAAPVMRKDFLVDPYQVAEARAAGAAGVLVVVRIVDDATLAAILARARELGLFALVECFDEGDLERAARTIEPGAPGLLVGVNARDLATLGVDAGRAARLVRGAPRGIPLVAESGIATPDHVERLAALGYRGALVGEALLRAADPEGLARRLIEAGRAARGRFGSFGGAFVPETLVAALDRLTREAGAALADPGFTAAVDEALSSWVGRPTPLTVATGLSSAWGAAVRLKREDLAHTGAHKINNAVGQALLAKRLGARRVIAETGAGQHGVAAAAACARAGLPLSVYMGADDVGRQAVNVQRIRRLGAEVVPVASGDRTLRAAIDEAIRAWVADPDETYYLIGSVVGPHPYPWLVRTFQAVIGREARAQALARDGRLPDLVVACVGGGSNALGLFHAFRDDAAVGLRGFEAGGRGGEPGEHAATIARGRAGVLHGAMSLVLQNDDGQVVDAHSIAPGLDYPGVGPEHAHLAASGRAVYGVVSDAEARDALEQCARLEGILPALESAHALAGARRLAEEHPGAVLLVGLSGRGDKDLATLEEGLA